MHDGGYNSDINNTEEGGGGGAGRGGGGAGAGGWAEFVPLARSRH